MCRTILAFFVLLGSALPLAAGPVTVSVQRESSWFGFVKANTFLVTIDNPQRRIGAGPGGAVVFIPESSLSQCLSISGIEVATTGGEAVMKTADWDAAGAEVDKLKAMLLAAKIVKIALQGQAVAISVGAELLQYGLGIPPDPASLALAYAGTLDAQVVAMNEAAIREILGTLLIDPDSSQAQSTGVTLQPGQKYTIRLTATTVGEKCFVRCAVSYRYIDGVLAGVPMMNSLAKIVLRRKVDPTYQFVISDSVAGEYHEGLSGAELDKLRNPTEQPESPLPPARSNKASLSVFAVDAGTAGREFVGGANVELYSGTLADAQQHGAKPDDVAAWLRGSGRPLLKGDTGQGELAGLCLFQSVPLGTYVLVVTHPQYMTWVGQVEVHRVENLSDPENRVVAMLTRGTPTPVQGMLDVVFCIDVSGSMMDDIQAVQKESVETLTKLSDYATASNISLQVGLATYTRHDEPNWIHADRLTTDIASLRGRINAIKITDPRLGRRGNEDTYGAVMYAMNQTVGGQQIEMGWRTGGDKGAAVISQNPASTGTPINLGNRAGAAKIIITMGDEPQDETDWENRKLEDVARVAKDLDPVHMYPILLPKEGSGFLNSAVAAKRRLAQATGGELIQVNKAADLPEALVSTVKLAVRQHKEEVWRKTHPPYLLYTMAAVLGLVTIVTLAGVFIMQFRQQEDLDGVSR